MLEAFNQIKVCLVHVCVLTIQSHDDIFVLHTDASGAGIGATLNVIREGEERPAAYFSRQLQGAQQRYSATELEGLAIFKSILFFSHFCLEDILLSLLTIRLWLVFFTPGC